jgi:DAK2 domain fusion protein YloV
MGLTMERAAQELRKKDFDTVASASDCVASALLRAARGNSGVILSLLFRGISKKLKGLHEADAKTFAAAMQEGVEAAYKAVMKPAEGTILTVSRVAAEAAKDAAKGGRPLEEMFAGSIAAAKDALEKTVEQNPVLARAGVVDAGGKGYVIMLEAFLASLLGEIRSGSLAVSEGVEPDDEDHANFGEFSTEEITFAYDTVYIVRKMQPEKPLDLLRAYLDSIGDSLVISEDDEVFKVHVHTNTPGDALTESQKYGTLETAKIENMRSQHDALVEKSAAKAEETPAEPAVTAPEKQYGFVAVCAGDGLARLFRELGCDRIVTGGQTMNPSTEDILREVNATPAETVFVFPNNKNIIMAAEQCVPLTEKQLIVVPTKTVPQGITALLNFDETADTETLTKTFDEVIAGVHTALVTYAARNSEYDGRKIKAGEYLGLMDGALLGSWNSVPALTKQLGKAVRKLKPEFVSVYYGADVTQEDAQALTDALTAAVPGAEISLVEGGQPVYYYMISVE